MEINNKNILVKKKKRSDVRRRSGGGLGHGPNSVHSARKVGKERSDAQGAKRPELGCTHPTDLGCTHVRRCWGVRV